MKKLLEWPRTRRLSALVAGCLCIGGANSLRAMDIQQLQVQFKDNQYQLTLTARLNAVPLEVERVLRDYAAYQQLDARILASQVVTRPAPNQVELFTRINVCFTFFCRKVERVELVKEQPGELLSEVIAARSDAKRGRTHTVLKPDGAGTLLEYSTQIEPKFWVPVLVGRPLMLRQLREATVSMFERVEQRAQHEQPYSAPRPVS